MIHTFLTYF